MNTTGMPAPGEATSHFNHIRTLDPDGGILAARQCGNAERGGVCGTSVGYSCR